MRPRNNRSPNNRLPDNRSPGNTSPNNTSRRQALALLLAACPCLRRLEGADGSGSFRLAISESMVSDVNLNDARAAMQMWIRRIESDLNLHVEFDGNVFAPTAEIAHGISTGQLDAAALTVVEYRPIAGAFDPTQLFVGVGVSGPDEYLILVRKDSPFTRLANLRGRRLTLLKTPKMCVAPAWLATLLDDEHLGTAADFFASLTWDSKVSRVVLPVFFNQVEACLTSRRGFDTMCELNPQVAQGLTAIATSPLLVTCFYAFRREYRGADRDKLMTLQKSLFTNPAGRQLATLFQFDELTVRDASCLNGSLNILDRAERLHSRQAAGGRRDK